MTDDHVLKRHRNKQGRYFRSGTESAVDHHDDRYQYESSKHVTTAPSPSSTLGYRCGIIRSLDCCTSGSIDGEEAREQGLGDKKEGLWKGVAILASPLPEMKRFRAARFRITQQESNKEYEQYATEPK